MSKKRSDLSVLIADTIRVGGSFMPNMKIGIAESTFFTGYPHLNALIGNKFFDNFSVVFDFKNQKLYLKPTE